MNKEELINKIFELDREIRQEELEDLSIEELKKLYNKLFEILRRLKEE